MTSSRETELKFDADATFRVPELAGLTTVDQRDVSLRAVYWDTDDLRLLTWRVTLRHRWASDHSEDGWTLKLPIASGGPNPVVRQELTAAGLPDAPPARFVQLVRAMTLDRPLHPVATIATRRRILELGADPWSASLELSDDLVESSVGDAAGPAFRQIEVELLDQDELATLDGVARDLLDAGLRTSKNRSKLEQVLGSRPHPPEPIELDSRSTLGEFTRDVLGRSAAELIGNDPGVRLGDDPEAVHQARVVTRRLRGLLKALRPFLVRSEVEPIRDELKWFAALLGEVRDGHVLRTNVDTMVRSFDAESDADRMELDDRIEQHARFHRAPLLSAMSGPRYLALLEAVTEVATDPPFRTASRAEERALPLLAGRARHSWTAIRRRVRRLDHTSTEVELHELRKQIKQLRYTAQAAQSVGARSKSFTKHLGRVQDQLGDLHDSVVAMAWLADQGPMLTTSAAFLAGRVHHGYDERRRTLRGSWYTAWERAAQPAHRRWMR